MISTPLPMLAYLGQHLEGGNSALGPGVRVAVELTLESAKELSGALARAIAVAEIEESARLRKV
jgi:hypothetical protein